MLVLKVELEGLTASFRYPHFMMGRHPSFPMPPPATIYGHICSALGEWVNPHDIRFAYIFTHDGKAIDLEHCYILAPRGPKAKFKWKNETIPVNLEGDIYPLQRDFFFRPHLTLYLNHPEWKEQFSAPRYPVVLGRSQDLAYYSKVTVVALEERDEAYYEHTLLPFEWRMRVGRGISISMPRFLDYSRGREPQFERYIALQERVIASRKNNHDKTNKWLHLETSPLTHWVDPETPEIHGCKRGVVFHTFVD